MLNCFFCFLFENYCKITGGILGTKPFLMGLAFYDQSCLNVLKIKIEFHRYTFVLKAVTCHLFISLQKICGKGTKMRKFGCSIFSQKLEMAVSDPTIQGLLSKYDQNKPTVNIVFFRSSSIPDLIFLPTQFFVDGDKFVRPNFEFHTEISKARSYNKIFVTSISILLSFSCHLNALSQ